MTKKSVLASCPPIGILDWGIGGFGFFKLLRERRPDVAVTYFSDSGEVPYGRLPKERLRARLRLIIRYLHRCGVTHLIVACNAMSTVLPLVGNQEQDNAMRVVGVIEPTIRAVLTSKNRFFGVVGGKRTILSGAYRTPLIQQGYAVHQRIAQPVSRMIEDGKINTPELSRILSEILRPLREVDALILGCTHYSAVLRHFSRLLPDAAVIDPAELTLAWINRHWRLPSSKKKRDVFFTTGPVGMMRTAVRKAFGIQLGTIRKLAMDLDRYR